MTSKQAQAWFLIRLLRGQDFLVEAGDDAVKIKDWAARVPRKIDHEVMKSVQCLKDEMLLVLRLEQRVRLVRYDDRGKRLRRKKWKYKRGTP